MIKVHSAATKWLLCVHANNTACAALSIVSFHCCSAGCCCSRQAGNKGALPQLTVRPPHSWVQGCQRALVSAADAVQPEAGCCSRAGQWVDKYCQGMSCMLVCGTGLRHLPWQLVTSRNYLQSVVQVVGACRQCAACSNSASVWLNLTSASNQNSETVL